MTSSFRCTQSPAIMGKSTFVWPGKVWSSAASGLARQAIDKVEALTPQHIVAGHQDRQLDDDAERTIAETRQYLDDADELLRTENAPSTSSTPRSRDTQTTRRERSRGPVPVHSTDETPHRPPRADLG